MAVRPISDYALTGNLRTAALVNRRAAIAWLYWPLSIAAHALRLAGTEGNGYWSSAPTASSWRAARGQENGMGHR